MVGNSKSYRMALVVALTALMIGIGITATSLVADAQSACGAGLVQEAESATLFGSMQVFEDDDASGGEFVRATDTSNSRQLPVEDDDNLAEFCFRIEEGQAGTYRIDAVTRSVDQFNDSFHVTVDDAEPFVWFFDQAGAWDEAPVSEERRGRGAKQFQFDVGDHIVKIHHRESNASLDKLELVALILSETTTPEPDDTTTPEPQGECGALRQEAEDGTVNGDMVVEADAAGDPASSEGSFVVARGEAGRPPFPSDHYVEYCVRVPADRAGTYRLFGTVLADRTTRDSFSITLDDPDAGGDSLDWNFGTTDGEWDERTVREIGAGNTAYVFDLDAGDHTLRFYKRERAAQLDSFRFVVVELNDAVTPEPSATATVGAFGDNSVGAGSTTIEAEDYDLGGPGVGYNDMDTPNVGGEYREDSVDIFNTQGGGDDDYTVGRTRGGEWLEYTLDVASAGDYEVTIRAATGFADPGPIAVSVDGAFVGRTEVDTDGNWWAFDDFIVDTASLTAGEQVLRLRWEGDGQVNLDSFTLRRLSQNQAAASNTPTHTPTVTNTPTATATPTVTNTPVPSATNTPTATATPTVTNTPLPTPTRVVITVVATITPRPVTATPTPSPTPVPKKAERVSFTG